MTGIAQRIEEEGTVATPRGGAATGRQGALCSDQ
jgi:hypothetical protein